VFALFFLNSFLNIETSYKGFVKPIDWNVWVPEIVSHYIKYHPKDMDNLFEKIQWEADVK
jgi:hypothetical protein